MTAVAYMPINGQVSSNSQSFHLLAAKNSAKVALISHRSSAFLVSVNKASQSIRWIVIYPDDGAIHFETARKCILTGELGFISVFLYLYLFACLVSYFC